MDTTIAAWLPMPLLESLAASPWGPFVLPALIASLTAGFVGFSIPGTIAPMSFISGLLLGIGGILVVALGVLVGSHVLFLASRRWLAGIMQERFGDRLKSVSEHLGRRGPVYVVIARLTGVPHVVVTAGCAATPITSRAFLAASLIGMLPAITLAHMAGHAL
ncbi:hypothetical protein GRI62_12170 [Erythrobacter arachoides]|uniref:TVP38/TMEM64 family membrane protein n=1 Tax=Aurantiacibacter arachoides TaxID=1850444 RepID=A0A845A4K2_9SPHN|nr:VTT domain-containing protein [Aurantiacibacter arachoides]MXO94352.1 hypothetical protein [Aurantiacibacter arachoides]